MVGRLLMAALALTSCASASPRVEPAKAATDASLTEKAVQVLTTAAHYARDVLTSPSGMVRADYDLMSGKWLDYEPHWHTGQLIWGLVEAWRITGDESLITSARRSGEWWIGTQFPPGHPLAGMVNAFHGDHVGPLINFTTVTDGTPGLFALSRATGDACYAHVASTAGDVLVARTTVPADIQGGAGLFYNFLDPDTGAVITDRSPTHPGVTKPALTQIARPNIEGFLQADQCRFTGDNRYCEAFVAHARLTLARQDAQGLWMDFEPNDPETGKVHPRFNVWNAEALLEAYQISGDRAFLEGAARTGRYMAQQQRRDGTIPYDLHESEPASRQSITGSASAFAAILWLRLRDYGVEGFDEPIARSLNFALSNQFPTDHPDPNLRGAILETRVRVVDGRTRIAIRDIATTFSLRFLALWLRDQRGEDVNAYLASDTAAAKNKPTAEPGSRPPHVAELCASPSNPVSSERP